MNHYPGINKIFFYSAIMLICLTGIRSQEIVSKTLKIGLSKNICGVTIPKHLQPNLSVIIWFHGGMNSSRLDKGSKAHLPLLSFVDSRKYILASPSSHRGFNWLNPKSIIVIDELLRYLINRYKIDTNKIHLIGVSDGGLAVAQYSHLGKYPIQNKVLISSFLPIIFKGNKLNQITEFKKGHWFFFQGMKDRLYPPESVLPFLQKWKSLYPNTQLNVYPDGLHDFGFYVENASDRISEIFKIKSSSKQ